MGVFQRTTNFELGAERKLPLPNSSGYQIVKIHLPAPFRVIVSKVEALQMRCGFNPHISRVKLVGFVLRRHELHSNDSKSSFW